ncbi:hypothetical protein U1Q18_005916, partial [Sarracenia purpurea var. burkii]
VITLDTICIDRVILRPQCSSGWKNALKSCCVGGVCVSALADFFAAALRHSFSCSDLMLATLGAFALAADLADIDIDFQWFLLSARVLFAPGVASALGAACCYMLGASSNALGASIVVMASDALGVLPCHPNVLGVVSALAASYCYVVILVVLCFFQHWCFGCCFGWSLICCLRMLVRTLGPVAYKKKRAGATHI